MLFCAKTLATLEFDKIIDMLCECAATDGAKARARALTPTDDYDLIVKRHGRVDDAKRLIKAKGYPSFSAQERVPDDQLVSFGTYPQSLADSAVSSIIGSKVVIDEVTGLWTVYNISVYAPQVHIASAKLTYIHSPRGITFAITQK